jgi:hypothetical protein
MLGVEELRGGVQEEGSVRTQKGGDRGEGGQGTLEALAEACQ